MEFTATEREMTTTAAREREARLKEQQEVSMLAQQSREGYFGETSASWAGTTGSLRHRSTWRQSTPRRAVWFRITVGAPMSLR